MNEAVNDKEVMNENRGGVVGKRSCGDVRADHAGIRPIPIRGGKGLWPSGVDESGFQSSVASRIYVHPSMVAVSSCAQTRGWVKTHEM